MNILNLFSSVSKMLPLIIEESMDNLSWIQVEDIVEMMEDNPDIEPETELEPEAKDPDTKTSTTSTELNPTPIDKSKTDTKTKTTSTPMMYTTRKHNIVNQLDDFTMFNETELFDHVETTTATNRATLETENIVPEDGSITNDPTYEELEDTNTYTKT